MTEYLNWVLDKEKRFVLVHSSRGTITWCWNMLSSGEGLIMVDDRSTCGRDHLARLRKQVTREGLNSLFL
jgi:hypothetical protein